MLRSPDVDPELKNPSNWPEPMRIEFGEDEGVVSSRTHRARLVEGFRKQLEELDKFNPDFVVIWGDDQYENFKEAIIPPSASWLTTISTAPPFGTRRPTPGENPLTKSSPNKSHLGAKALVTDLINQGIDMAYSYRPLHEEAGLGHAFINTLLYLDYDRKGFPYPVIPFQVNCYGSKVILNHGGAIEFHTDNDPPGPTSKRCMEIGAAVVRAINDSPYRVALIASSSWSHVFLTDKHDKLWPDQESDRARFEELKDADWDAWRNLSTPQIEAAGQQEILN